METFVALMRGINMGSTRKLPMAELRALSVKIGLQRVTLLLRTTRRITLTHAGMLFLGSE